MSVAYSRELYREPQPRHRPAHARRGRAWNLAKILAAMWRPYAGVHR